jgi:hypothetical protein
MNDPLKALIEAGAIDTSPFAPTSRYHGLPHGTHTQPGQDAVAYVKRRFVPAPERFALVQEHLVVQGDRLDNLAAQYLGDPEMYWRLADANGAVRPAELVEEPGRRLAIALPEGIPGPRDE